MKTLNLRDNKIEKLPENISLLQHLVRFDITNNNLSALVFFFIIIIIFFSRFYFTFPYSKFRLPSNLGLLAHLQSLQLEGNKVLALRRGVMQGGTGRVLKFLRDKLSPEELDPENASANEIKWPDKYNLWSINFEVN